MTEQFANLAQTSLASSITATQTTFNVVSAALFPSTGNFRIVVQSFDPVTGNAISQPEIMLVTAVSGNQFTVQRAAETSGFFPAIAFASGATVANILTAAVMNALESGTGVSSLNTLTGAITLAAGTNTTITPSGNTLTISSTGSGGGAVSSVSNSDGSVLVTPTTGNVTVSLPSSGVSAGSYTNANITVNADGIITLASTGSGGGAVSSVSNSDGSLTISPTVGAIVASINAAHANTFSATQTFSTATATTYTGTTINLTGNGTLGALTVEGNVTMAQMTAATSSVKQVPSNILTLSSNAWNSSPASAPGNLTIQYSAASGDNSLPALLNFQMGQVAGAFTAASEVRFEGTNAYINVFNSNDSVSAFFGESFQTASFGMKNDTGSTQGIIPAGALLALLGLNQNGQVFSSQGQLNGGGGNSIPRNMLDDGTSSANASFITNVTAGGTVSAVTLNITNVATVGSLLFNKAGPASSTAVGGRLVFDSANFNTWVSAGNSANLIFGTGSLTAGGLPSTALAALGASGGFNLTTGPYEVGGIPIPGVLASVTGINGLATGSTLLYTNATGGMLLISDVALLVTAATAATGGPTVQIGTTTTGSDVYASIAITALTATNAIYHFGGPGMSKVIPNGGSLYMDITNAGAGTTLTLRALVLGAFI